MDWSASGVLTSLYFTFTAKECSTIVNTGYQDKIDSNREERGHHQISDLTSSTNFGEPVIDNNRWGARVAREIVEQNSGRKSVPKRNDY